MIKLIAVLLLATVPSFATDVCYLFPRGSESWKECKEQAAVFAERNERMRQESIESTRQHEDRVNSLRQAAAIRQAAPTYPTE